LAETLDILLKVARARRDSAVQAMNAAQQHVAQVRRELTNLEALERGMRPTDETIFATGTFLCHITRRKRQLLDQLPGLERALDTAKQELLEAFGDYKRLELLVTRQARSEAQEEARRDSLVVDELAQLQYINRRARP
jgi:flagellar export protein FliJ